LLLTDLVDGCVNGLYDMETIQNQLGIGAVVLDRPHVSFTHVTRGPLNLFFLICREPFIKENVDCFPALAFADPYDTGSIQVIDDGCILVALAIGDLIDTDGFKPSDPMAIPQSGNALVEQIRQGGGRDVKELGGSLLGHQLAVYEQGIFEPIGNSSVWFRPWNHFLDAAVGGAQDLFGAIPEKDTPSA
jgi:hypothetical protein